MKDIDLKELSDQELLEKQKKNKSVTIMNAVLCGVLIGIAIYSTINNGFRFFTLVPLFFVFIAFNNKQKGDALENEIKSRNLR